MQEERAPDHEESKTECECVCVNCHAQYFTRAPNVDVDARVCPYLPYSVIKQQHNKAAQTPRAIISVVSLLVSLDLRCLST